MKTRNAAYGNNSAAIGSQKRVSDSENYIKDKKFISMLFQVVYGSTQLTNAAQFLGQLARLGAEQ